MIFSILELILEDAIRDCKAVCTVVLRLLSDGQALWSLGLRDDFPLSTRDVGDEPSIIIMSSNRGGRHHPHAYIVAFRHLLTLILIQSYTAR